jgi:glycosyltransferase involved in cell wall biosynthesis
VSRIVVIGGFSESLIQFRLQFLQAIVSAGHEVIALGPEHHVEIVEKLAEKGIQFRQYSLDRNGTNLFRDLRSLIELISIFLELRPNLIFSYTIKPVIYGSLAARLTGVKNTYSMITGLGYAFLGGRRNFLLNRLVTWLYRVALTKNSCVFFQNPDDMTLFFNKGLVRNQGRAIVVNGSGVDLNHYRYTWTPETGGFLMIARLILNKGIREYVGAARVLKFRYPNVVFQLAGWIEDGPDSINVHELNEWIGEGTIEFLGKLGDVRPALDGCMVYVLPSYREGTPRSVLEAMAVGRAIITTDAPGCRETVVNGENGFLVPIKSAESLAYAMEKFVLDPTLAIHMGLRSREIVEDRYDVHKVNEVLLQEMGLL